ncbi:MAG: prepilin-type N-terminal cleavage/methylation domain-containing protein [Fimbriimonas sp.]
MNHKNRAFTLIELLVVIAIIAILAAILFPVFAQAKASAKKTQSLSNLKQSALGVLMYLTDYDDTFPVGCPDDWQHKQLDATSTPTTPVAGWTQTTKPYIKNVGILRDPSDAPSATGLNTYLQQRLGAGGDAIFISYVSNGWMDDRGSGWGVYGVMGMAQNWMSGPKVINQSVVSQSADTIMLTTRYNSTDVWGPDSFISGVSWWDGYVGVGGLAPDGTRNGNPYVVNGRVVSKDNRTGGSISAYTDNAIYAWVDGHASVKKPASTNPNPSLNPEKNQWDAQRKS